MKVFSNVPGLVGLPFCFTSSCLFVRISLLGQRFEDGGQSQKKGVQVNLHPASIALPPLPCLRSPRNLAKRAVCNHENRMDICSGCLTMVPLHRYRLLAAKGHPCWQRYPHTGPHGRNMAPSTLITLTKTDYKHSDGRHCAGKPGTDDHSGGTGNTREHDHDRR